MGELHEVLHERSLIEPYKREEPFKRQVSDQTMLSGRVDFLFDDRIDECKSSFSKDTVRAARHGKPKTGHLAQLVCYLLEFGLTRGRLIYGYYERNRREELVKQDEAVVEVGLQDGQVTVNGSDTGYKLTDLSNSIVQLDKWLHSDQPAPRPAVVGFGGACRYCPMKALCDRIDQDNLSVSECKQEAHSLLAKANGPTPRVGKVKE